MAVSCNQRIRGIESYPSQMRQERFDPGVGRIRNRAVIVFLTMVEISAHVATRDSELPNKRDHDVGEILANALPRTERFIDRRINAGGTRRIAETLVQLLVQLTQQHHGIVTAVHAKLAR